MSFLSANFMLQRYCIKHYRKCFCPTCASSFPIAEFCNYIQTIVSILFLKLYYIGWVLLNWGTGAYIQGSFLSTCLSRICCVWKFIFKNHHPSLTPQNGGCIVLFMSVGHIASHGKPTLCGNEITIYTTTWKHRLMYYVILHHNAIMCIITCSFTKKERETSKFTFVHRRMYSEHCVLWNDENRPLLRYPPAT